jgi:uroporphyrin-III C-methyltransferase / precorrin-2 dehydrogenase / sirohydrochlorin ferrochelatase
MALVIATTDDIQLNNTIAQQVKLKNIWVNVINNLESGTFIMPSVIERRPVMIAVSSGGASPVLARLLRGCLEILIP